MLHAVEQAPCSLLACAVDHRPAVCRCGALRIGSGVVAAWYNSTVESYRSGFESTGTIVPGPVRPFAVLLVQERHARRRALVAQAPRPGWMPRPCIRAALPTGNYPVDTAITRIAVEGNWRQCIMRQHDRPQQRLNG